MLFAPQVERWRADVAAIYPPELVDKALWVINWESGGNPNATGDGGIAIGLFQIQAREDWGRPPASWLKDPKNNIRYAALDLGSANGDWSAWGEGTDKYDYPYDPNTGLGKFGALGNHPFPTGSTAGFPANVIDGATGAVGDAVGGATGAVGDAVGVVGDVAGSVKRIADGLLWLINPKHIMRVFFVLAGSVLIVVGMYVYIRGTSNITSDVKQVAGIGAMAAL